MHIEEHAPKCVSRYLNTLQFLFFSSFFCVRCVQFRFPATERPNIHYIYDVSFFFCTKLNGNSDYWKRIYVCMTFVDEQTYRHHRTVHSKCLSDLTDLHSAEILMDIRQRDQQQQQRKKSALEARTTGVCYTLQNNPNQSEYAREAIFFIYSTRMSYISFRKNEFILLVDRQTDRHTPITLRGIYMKTRITLNSNAIKYRSVNIVNTAVSTQITNHPVIVFGSCCYMYLLWFPSAHIMHVHCSTCVRKLNKVTICKSG